MPGHKKICITIYSKNTGYPETTNAAEINQCRCYQMCHVMRKPYFSLCENKGADQLRSNFTAKLISAFIFATPIVQSFFFLNPNFQASSYPLWLYRLVCIRPGRKPRGPVFSLRGSKCANPFGNNLLCRSK